MAPTDIIDPGQWSCGRHGPWVAFDGAGEVRFWGEYVDEEDRSMYTFGSGRLYAQSIDAGTQHWGFHVEEGGRLSRVYGTDTEGPGSGLSVDLVPQLPESAGVKLDGEKVGYWATMDPNTRKVTWTYHPAVREYPP